MTYDPDGGELLPDGSRIQATTAGELADPAPRTSPAEVNQPAGGRRCGSFVQYKGTDICIDIYCECGVQLHFDGDFAYAIRCWSCKSVWVLPSNLTLVEGLPPSGIVKDAQRGPDEALEDARWR